MQRPPQPGPRAQAEQGGLLVALAQVAHRLARHRSVNPGPQADIASKVLHQPDDAGHQRGQPQPTRQQPTPARRPPALRDPGACPPGCQQQKHRPTHPGRDQRPEVGDWGVSDGKQKRQSHCEHGQRNGNGIKKHVERTGPSCKALDHRGRPGAVGPARHPWDNATHARIV
ncbi:hypothetical protein D3C71_1129020 [compost metagenome]